MRRKNGRAWAGAWCLLTDWGLLFLALISVVFGAVTAYHMNVLSSAIWAGAFVLSWGAVGLMKLSRYRLPAVLGVLALWGWGLWRLWEPLVWGGARIQCDVVNTIAAKVPTVTGIVPALELPEEVWARLTTLWLLMVGVVYALALGWLLGQVRHGLPVVLWTLLPILPALCVTEAPDVLPVVGLLAVWLTLVLTSFTGRRDPAGTARLRPVALLCVLALLAAWGKKLPTQGTAQPLWAADLRDIVINEASRGDLSALLTRWSGWMGTGSTEYMNLLGSTPSQTGRVALRVEASRGGKYYLRGYSADIYTGRRWEPLGRTEQRELEKILETGVEPLLELGRTAGETAGYRYESYRNGHTSVVTGDGSAAMTVENVAAPGGCVYYPYGLAELPENAAFGGDSHLERTGAAWEHTFSFYPGWESVSLYDSMVYGSLPDSSGGRLPPQRGEEDLYPDFVYAHELQVPEDLRPILEQWLLEGVEELWGEGENMARTLEGLTLESYTRYALAYNAGIERAWEQSAREPEETRWALVDEYYRKGPGREELEAVTVTQENMAVYRPGFTAMLLDLVQNRLAQTTRYDRNTPAPPAGEDYVDWFLNESRQGYCMHYATAATLLLRTAGIPARYVSGYVVDIPFQGKTEVTDYAAHAWVEIYLDKVGWYPLEVTPGFQSNAMGDIPDLEREEVQSAAPSTRPGVASTPSPSPEPSQTPSAAPSAAPTPSAEPSRAPGPEGLGGEGSTVFKGVWYALGTLAAVLLAALVRRALLRRRQEKLRGKDANVAVLYAYRCHRGLKPWGGQESGELTALAEKARFSQHTLTQAEQDRGAELFQEEAHRVYGVLPEWKKPLFTLLWGK